MHTLWALAAKDLRLMMRDRIGFFFTLVFPMLVASFFGMIFSGEGERGGISVLVVDEDQTPESRAFIERLQQAEELRLKESTRDKATEAVRRGDVTAYLALPKGFGLCYARPFRYGFPEVEAGIDPARKASAGLLQGVLTKHLFAGISERLRDREALKTMVAESMADVANARDMDPVWRTALTAFLPALQTFVDQIPVDESGESGEEDDADFFGGLAMNITPVTRDRNYPRSSYDISFPQGIIWGMLACAATFGISLVVERTHGTLVRLRVAPLGVGRILAGKAVACFLSIVAVGVILVLFARVVFHVRPDSAWLLAAALISSAICFVGIMMLLSVMGKTEQSAGGIGWAVMMVMAMFGGGMVPLFFMPKWMIPLSHFSPVKWTVYALEGAMWRGFSPEEMMLPCTVLIVTGVVCFFVGRRIFLWLEPR